MPAQSAPTPTPSPEAPRHTPGPWFLKRPGVIAERATGELVATCGYRVRVGSNEDEANATLIVQATAMMALLRQLVDGYAAGDCDLQSLAREAASIIAAATGEA